MRLFRRRGVPETCTRAAGPYLEAGADEARRLGHNYVGTEHVLAVLVRRRHGGATRVLEELGVSPAEAEDALACRLPPSKSRLDPDALSALGIDLEAVRERVEETFGPGALEQTRAGCLGVCPRLKRALLGAFDHADDRALGDEHILLGLLSVPDCVAARLLADFDVSLESAAAVVARSDQ
jgi:ATP-dependent Clp protease ATP-binding subunit ClpA